MGTRWIGLLLALVATGCGQTLVVNVPDVPPLLRPREEPHASAGAPLPRVECNFMTVMIEYSRNGTIDVAARVARTMADEFEQLGTHVTHSSDQAFWSLMILASDNSRKDGFIFSAMLSARNMNEGYDPGVTVFRRDSDAEKPSEERKDKDKDKVATMYNGLSYGPYETLEDQARLYVRQAYAAVFPYSQRLCAFEAADKQREQGIDAEVPGVPAPL